MDVTLEKGITSLLIKKFKNEKIDPDKDTRCHPQLVTESVCWKLGL